MNRVAPVVLLSFVSLAACGPMRHHGGESAPGPGAVRLCIRNAAEGYGSIVAHAGLVRFDVIPGTEVCKDLSGSGPSIQLRANTTGGGSSGPLSYATTLRVGATDCWRWRLGSSESTAIDLLPCGNP